MQQPGARQLGDPFLVLGNLVGRILLKLDPASEDEEGKTMVNATEIWELAKLHSTGCHNTDQWMRRFVDGRQYLSEFVFVTTAKRTGRLLLTETAGADTELYVSVALLREALDGPSGDGLPLRPAPVVRQDIVAAAASRVSREVTERKFERDLEMIDQKLSAIVDVSEPGCGIEGIGQQLLDDGAAAGEEEGAGVVELTAKRIVAFRILLGVLLLGVSVVMVVLSVLWLDMAQKGIEQPAVNYLQMTNRIVKGLAFNILSPPREATDVLFEMAVMDKHMEHLGTPWVVDGSNRFGVLTNITTSLVLSDVVHARRFIQYLGALFQTYYPKVQYLGAGFEEGTLIGVFNYGTGFGVQIRDSLNLFGKGDCLNMYSVDSTNDVLLDTVEYGSCTYDPRTRPWYRDGITAAGKAWGGIYVDINTGLQVLPAIVPLYPNGDTSAAPLGTFTGETGLGAITDFLKSEIKVGKTGVAYLYERDDNMVAASKGLVADGEQKRVKVGQSSDATIRKSDQFLKSQVGEDVWSASQLLFGGEALADDPMQLTSKFVNEDLEWLITSMVPASDYYGFMQTTSTNVYLTIVAFVVVFLVDCCSVSASVWLIPNLNGVGHVRGRVLQGLTVTAIICVFLYILWLTVTSNGVSELAETCMNNTIDSIRQEVSYHWENLNRANNMTNNLHISSVIVLDAVTSPSNTLMDSYFLRQLEIFNESKGVGVGFEENGNFYGAYNIDGVPFVVVRDINTTNGNLVYYHVIGKGGSRMRDVSNISWTSASFDSRQRPWYQAAKTQVQINGPTNPRPALAQPYSSSGTFYESVNQPFYTNVNTNEEPTFAGVLITEGDATYYNKMLHSTLIEYATGVSLLILQNIGEISGRANGINTMVNSEGKTLLVNVTAAADDAAKVSEIVLHQFGGMIEAQGHAQRYGDKYTHVAAAGWPSTYIAREISTELNKLSVLAIIPHYLFFTEYEEYANSTFATFLAAFTLLYLYTLFVCKLMSWTLKSTEERVATRMKKLSLATEYNQQFGAAPVEMNDLHQQLGSIDVGMNDLTIGGFHKSDLDPSIGSGNGQHSDNAQFTNDTTIETDNHSHNSVHSTKSTSCVQWFAVFCYDPSADPLKCEGVDLEQLTRRRLAPMVKKWTDKLGDEQLVRAKLQNRAVEYLLATKAGQPVYDTASMDSRLQRSDWRSVLCILWGTTLVQWIVTVVIFVFLFVELFPKDYHVTLDIILGLVLTTDSAMRLLRQHAANGWVRMSSMAQIFATLLFWILFLALPEASGIVKPLIILTTIPQLQAAGVVFCLAIIDSKTVFFLLFCVAAQAAIVMLFLFHEGYDVLDPNLGANATSFLNTFVSMIAFLTSGDNWSNVVDPMWKANKATAPFWIFFSVAGMLFLTSMVLAIFEKAFDQNKGELEKESSSRMNASLCCSFILWTWFDPAAVDETGSSLTKQDFMELMKQCWNYGNREKHKGTLDSQEEGEPVKVHVPPTLSTLWGAATVMMAKRVSSADTDYQTLLAESMFMAVDDDASGLIHFHEFQEIFCIAICIDKIKKDKLLGSRAIESRWELEEKELGAAEQTPANRALHTKLMHYTATHNTMEKIERMEKKRRILGLVRWKTHDKFLTIILIIHSYILSLYNGNILSERTIYTLSAILCIGVYPIEIMLRIHSVGGIRALFRTKVYPHETWSMVCQTFLTVWGFLFAIAWLVQDSSHALGESDESELRWMQGCMALAVWRIFFCVPSFAQMLYSLYHGIQGVDVFVQLLVLALYSFAFIGWRIFEGKLAGATYHFDTLGDSLFTLFVIFIGGGWTDTMQLCIMATNTALVWFFITYVMLGGLLFMELFVAIIINLFQTILESHATRCGELDLVFHWELIGMDDDQRNHLYKQLGCLAASLYSPAMKSAKGLLVLTHKHRHKIEQCGADLELWAVLRLQSAFRSRAVRRELGIPSSSVGVRLVKTMPAG